MKIDPGEKLTVRNSYSNPKNFTDIFHRHFQTGFLGNWDLVLLVIIKDLTTFDDVKIKNNYFFFFKQ
jgi:hypothetical protein